MDSSFSLCAQPARDYRRSSTGYYERQGPFRTLDSRLGVYIPWIGSRDRSRQDAPGWSDRMVVSIAEDLVWYDTLDRLSRIAGLNAEPWTPISTSVSFFVYDLHLPT